MINILGHGLTYGLKIYLFLSRGCSGISLKKVDAFLVGFFCDAKQDMSKL
jgi:hypothetical protein